MLKVTKFRCRMSILPWSEGWDVLGEGVPRAGRSHGWQLPGHPRVISFLLLGKVTAGQQ